MIRLAYKEEYQFLIDQEYNCFNSDWITIEDCNQKYTYVLSENSIIKGHYLYVNNKIPYLYSLLVYPEYRNKGYSKMLLTHFILETSKHQTLHVNVDNITALNLYKSFGFKIIRKELNFYEDGTNAYFMSR